MALFNFEKVPVRNRPSKETKSFYFFSTSKIFKAHLISQYSVSEEAILKAN